MTKSAHFINENSIKTYSNNIILYTYDLKIKTITNILSYDIPCFTKFRRIKKKILIILCKNQSSIIRLPIKFNNCTQSYVCNQINDVTNICRR